MGVNILLYSPSEWWRFVPKYHKLFLLLAYVIDFSWSSLFDVLIKNICLWRSVRSRICFWPCCLWGLPEKKYCSKNEGMLPWRLIYWIPEYALRVMYVLLWLTCWILRRGFQGLDAFVSLSRLFCGELTQVTSPQPETFLDSTRIQCNVLVRQIEGQRWGLRMKGRETRNCTGHVQC